MTTWVSRHQKGRSILDFNEARDDGVTVASAGPLCKSFTPRCRQITIPVPHHSAFTGQMPFLPPNQQRQSTEGILTKIKSILIIPHSISITSISLQYVSLAKIIGEKEINCILWTAMQQKCFIKWVNHKKSPHWWRKKSFLCRYRGIPSLRYLDRRLSLLILYISSAHYPAVNVVFFHQCTGCFCSQQNHPVHWWKNTTWYTEYRPRLILIIFTLCCCYYLCR